MSSTATALLAAFIGAFAKFLFDRVRNKRLSYRHRRDFTLLASEIVSQHHIEVKYGNHLLTGNAYFTELRVSNVGSATLDEVTIRFVSRNDKLVRIINVLAHGQTSFLTERLIAPTGDHARTTMGVRTMPTRSYIDIQVVVEAEVSLVCFEQAVFVEIEADGIRGTPALQDHWLFEGGLEARRAERRGPVA